jgi:hypothetical protein
MVDWSDAPVGGWMFDDPELQALKKSMERGGELTQQYRKKSAEARARGTENRLAAFAPANRTLTKLMGGEEQFDLGSFTDPVLSTPGFFGEQQQQPFTPMTQEELVQETGNVVERLQAPGGRNDQAKAMSDQQAFYSGLTGPIGPLLGASPAATHNADLNAIYANQQANNAGFRQGETGPPPWWDPDSMGAWIDENAISYSDRGQVEAYGGPKVPQYTVTWHNMTPEEQLRVIQEGRESEYQYFDPNNPGQVLMAEPQFEGELSDEELNRLLGDQ